MLTELATQLNLLAQSPNFEDWGDLLILAVMALLWLGGALVKVISSSRKRPRQQQQEMTVSPQGRPRETWQQKLARKAEEMQRAMEARGRQMEQAQAQKPRPAQPSAPPAGRITVRPGPKGDSILVYERPTSPPATEGRHQVARQREIKKAVLVGGHQAAKIPAVEPRVEIGRPGSEPILEGMAGLMREPPKPVDIGSIRSGTARQSAGIEPDAIIDYSDPEALKKAILHYEILGKPMALRDPPAETSSF